MRLILTTYKSWEGILRWSSLDPGGNHSKPPHPAALRIQDTTMRLKQYELQEAQIWQAQLAHAEQRVADYYAQVWVVESWKGLFF